MKKYLITWTERVYCAVEVEAASYEEAYQRYLAGAYDNVDEESEALDGPEIEEIEQ